MDSIVRIVTIFIIYSFIVVTCYFLLSTPIEMVFDGFAAADFAAAEDEINTYLPNYRNVLTLFFALFISIPLSWFVMKVFSREPAYYGYRRY